MPAYQNGSDLGHRSIAPGRSPRGTWLNKMLVSSICPFIVLVSDRYIRQSDPSFSTVSFTFTSTSRNTRCQANIQTATPLIPEDLLDAAAQTQITQVRNLFREPCLPMRPPTNLQISTWSPLAVCIARLGRQDDHTIPLKRQVLARGVQVSDLEVNTHPALEQLRSSVTRPREVGRDFRKTTDIQPRLLPAQL